MRTSVSDCFFRLYRKGGDTQTQVCWRKPASKQVSFTEPAIGLNEIGHRTLSVAGSVWNHVPQPMKLVLGDSGLYATAVFSCQTLNMRHMVTPAEAKNVL